MAIFLVFMSVFPVTLWAQASSIVIAGHPPGVSEVTDTFRMRERHPVTGQRRMHNGVDYRARTPTVVQTAAPVTSCRYSNGYGYLASVTRTCANGNTVTERYAHLTRCPENGATSVLTGNSGRGTGPHLHYEVMLGGSFVDPQAAFGRDLCDPEVRNQLLEHARQQGAGTGGNPPPAGNATIAPANIPPTTGEVLPPASETTGEVTGCATDTWVAMVNQSVLQTRREMLMNQRYIAKADSVLTYSCFRDMYTRAGETLGMFSESQRWVNRQVDIIGRVITINVNMGQNSLDAAISTAVDAAVRTYLDTNFNHELLGGLLSGPRPSGGGAAQSQYGAACGVMGQVWQMAKCHNVTDSPMFYRFEDLIDNDPRIYPHAYACMDSGITQSMIDIARHENVDFDDIETYLDVLYPEGGACAAPIPTGITITRSYGEDRITEQRTYDDALCITAGCSYQNPEFSGLGTCEIAEP